MKTVNISIEQLNKVEVYSMGITSCSICVPKELTIKQIEEAANTLTPTNIGTDWKVSNDKFFNDGTTPMPKVCEVDKDKKHYLLYC